MEGVIFRIQKKWHVQRIFPPRKCENLYHRESPNINTFLLIHFLQDSTFSWSDFTMKNNSELLNNLGNFINRTLMFLKNNFDRCVSISNLGTSLTNCCAVCPFLCSTVPDVKLFDEDVELVVKVTRELKGFIQCLESVR